MKPPRVHHINTKILNQWIRRLGSCDKEKWLGHSTIDVLYSFAKDSANIDMLLRKFIILHSPII